MLMNYKRLDVPKEGKTPCTTPTVLAYPEQSGERKPSGEYKKKKEGLPSGTLRERLRTERPNATSWHYETKIRDPRNPKKWKTKSFYVPIGKRLLVQQAIAQRLGREYILQEVLNQELDPTWFV